MRQTYAKANLSLVGKGDHERSEWWMRFTNKRIRRMGGGSQTADLFFHSEEDCHWLMQSLIMLTGSIPPL